MTSSWSWIWPAVMFVVPTLLALAIAWFFWGGTDSMGGNVAGLFVILIALLALVMREVAGVLQEKSDCPSCQIQPHEFTRYVIYAGIAFIDIVIVFMTGLWVEARRRRAA